jgi:hypothetical protein
MTTPDPTNPGLPDAAPASSPVGAGETAPSPSTESSAPPAWATPPPAGSSDAVPPAPAGPGIAPPPASPPAWSASSRWPERQEPRTAGLVMGVVLIVVGALFLILRLTDIALGPDAWPLWLIVPGIAMLAGSLLIPSRGGLGLAVPGTIIAVVGAILWVQSAYDVYATWAYAWALVAPTAPGIAMLAVGAVQRDGDLVRDGVRATITGLGLFVGFGIFFEGVVGISGHRVENLDRVLPYAAIALGLVLIVLAVVDGGRRDRWRDQRRAEREVERAHRRADRAARRAAR